MQTFQLLPVCAASALACVGIGGGLYEFSVVDPVWPRRPDIVQPDRGGLSRKRFWIAAHSAFEIALIWSLVAAWSVPEVRFWLWIAFISHVGMRIWSGFDFIPKALAFERRDPQDISEQEARRWTRRSLLRLPLDLIAAGAMFAALVAAAR